MLILPAEADEATVSTSIDRIAKIIGTDGGEIGKIDRWGRRRFAFELAGQNEGYYVVVRFTAEPKVQTELERALKLADEVIRHKVMLPPEQSAKQRTQAKPSPAPTGA
jgi:small subunit ribosomal protein S6